MRRMLGLATVLLLTGAGSVAAAQMAMGGDERELVALPPPMQAHMLANMRDHLAALHEIFGALAAGRAGEAADIAEARLGMSSMAAHGAEHMGPFMPEPMRATGTAMHRAASRFALAVHDADAAGTQEATRALFAAFEEVAGACAACHSAYRIR